jgi:hypothetical protein
VLHTTVTMVVDTDMVAGIGMVVAIGTVAGATIIGIIIGGMAIITQSVIGC